MFIMIMVVVVILMVMIVCAVLMLTFSLVFLQSLPPSLCLAGASPATTFYVLDDPGSNRYVVAGLAPGH